jgi:hypothetical protein
MLSCSNESNETKIIKSIKITREEMTHVIFHAETSMVSVPIKDKRNIIYTYIDTLTERRLKIKASRGKEYYILGRNAFNDQEYESALVYFKESSLCSYKDAYAWVAQAQVYVDNYKRIPIIILH